MQVPLQVTFRGLPVSDEIEAQCTKEIEKLERYYDRIIGCKVVVAEPHHSHHKGNLYSIRIEVTVPGSDIVVNREPPEHRKDEDLHLAIREAFDTARRRLEDAVRKQRGAVKLHETPQHGRVRELDLDQGFGFIETSDGRDAYFHRNSVLGEGFDRLTVGAEVRFEEEQGERGLQATSVRLVGRHHHLT